MDKKENSAQKSLASRILCYVAMAAVACILFLIAYLLIKSRTEVEPIEDERNVYKASEEDRRKHPYLTETNFHGEFDDLSLFDYPFKRSDSYICNRDLDQEELCEVLSQRATDYVEGMLNVNYRDLAADPQSYLENLSRNCIMDIQIMTDLTDEGDGEIISREEYLEKCIDYFVQNRVSMDASFMTSTSLVWKDDYYFCRGMIDLTVNTADSLKEFEEEITLGEPKKFMVELAFRLADVAIGEDQSDYINKYKVVFLQDTIAFRRYLDSET
ncbi:MAG: hypothetical protein K2O59_01690 [Lachnospiraceae bacterium]|nr:hypothetical protein [Lachnospiraceae bacterium]